MAGEYVLSVVMKAQDSASNIVSGFIDKLGGAVPGVAGIGLAVAGAAVAFGAAATKMAADYEQQMNMVQSLTGSTDAQMQQYKTSIRSVSDETGKSSMELSKGLYQVISAGFQGADATKVLGLAAKDSVIGLTDQETTTKALVVALNSYKIGAKDADTVSNQMLKTTALGRMSLSDYANALATGAAAAHGNGVSMAEMNATLATLTANGVKTAGVAMTDLTNLTGVMDGKTDMMTKRIQAQGISFDETKFKTLSYSDQVKYLGDKLSGLSYGQKQQILGSKNAAQALQILHDNSKMYTSDVATLSDKQKLANDAQKSWQKTQSGFNQSMTRVKTQLDNVMISIGEKLLPVLGKLMDKVSPLIQKFADWMEKSGAVDKVMDGLTTGIDLVGKGFELAWPYIQQMAQAVMDFSRDIATRLQPIIKNIVDGFKDYWPTIQTIVSGVFDAVKGIIQVAWSIISGIFKIALDLISGNWKQAWTDFLDMLKGIWAGIQSFIKGEVKIFLGYIQGILTAFGLMKGGIQQSTDDMKRQSEMKTSAMKAQSLAHTEQMAMGNIKNLEKQRLGIIAQLQQTKDPATRHMLEMKLKTVEQSELQQKGVVQAADTQRKKTMEHINKLKQDEIEAHKSMWQKSMDAVTNFGRNFGAKVQEIAGNAWSWIKNLWHNIQTTFERAWSDHVSRPLNDLGKKITDFFNNFIRGASDFGSRIVGGIADGIRGAVGNATGAISDVMSAIGNYLPHSPAKEGELAHLNEYGPSLVTGFSKGIVSSIPSLTKAMDLMTQPIGSTLASIQGGSFAVQANGSTYTDPAMAATAAALPAGNGQVIHYHTHTLTINAPHMDAKALAKAVNDENNKRYRMTGTHITNTSGAKVV